MAHAAITSLMNTIEQSVESTGLTLQSLYQELYSLRAILEKPWKVTHDLKVLTSLEKQISELAYRAEDMVDSKSRHVFLAENETKRRKAFLKLNSLLKQAVSHIDFTMNKWMAIQKKHNNSKNIQRLKAQNLSTVDTSQDVLQPENLMVGLVSEFEMILDQLARGGRELEVFPIVGMGGIGKTTLATKIYSDPFVMSHFDIRAKTTVSHEYSESKVLRDLLSSIGGTRCEMDTQDDGQLADRLQKSLKGRRYLIVIDDLWAREAWDDMRRCFPDYNNGSRILLTTRDVEVAEYASFGKAPYQLRLLNDDESWNLLYKKVFEGKCYSAEFEQLGKQIALGCKGLPLAIVVISGILSQIGDVLDEWRSVAENVNSLVSADTNAQCLRLLALSYHHLPHHLRMCFLYFAIFPEDQMIFVNRLMKLWAGEGFLKENERESTKEVARRCLKDLVNRSLIFIHSLSFEGKIKICGMHDMIREFCLREARNMNFLSITTGISKQNPLARVMFSWSKPRYLISIQDKLDYNQLNNGGFKKTRALIQLCRDSSYEILQKLGHFKLIRVLDLGSVSFYRFPNCILDLFHLRYLVIVVPNIPSSITTLHYLQTFIMKSPKGRHCCLLPPEIFTMQQLRDLYLPWSSLQWSSLDGEPSGMNVVLKNLKCLSGWNPTCCTLAFFRLLPNVKKLQIFGSENDYKNKSGEYNVLSDLFYLDKLETLKFGMSWNTDYNSMPFVLPPLDAFPQNLKKLSFNGTSLPWKYLNNVCKLPKLEALKLEFLAFRGEEWEIGDGGFPNLKFLLLKDIHFKYWRASDEHFPCLERLFLKECQYLDSIPQDFSYITTLQLIDITNCQASVVDSAKRIQEDVGDNILEVCISSLF